MPRDAFEELGISSPKRDAFIELGISSSTPQRDAFAELGDIEAYRLFQQPDAVKTVKPFVLSWDYPIVRDPEKKSFIESVKTVGAGLVEGILPEATMSIKYTENSQVHEIPSSLGVFGPAATLSNGLWYVHHVLDKSFKLDEIRAQYGDDNGYKVAKFIGEIAPISSLLKAGGFVGKTITRGMVKKGLKQITEAAVRGATTGALYGTYKESGKGFNPTEIAKMSAMFAIPETVLASGGVALKNIMGEIHKNPATEWLYKDKIKLEPRKLSTNITLAPGQVKYPSLIVNDIYANEKARDITGGWNKFKAAGNITSPLPGVRADERAVIMGIPIEPVPTNPLRKVSDAIEVAARTHEKFGTRQLMLDPVRQANGLADRAVSASEAEVTKIIKDNLPVLDRRKNSERIYSFAIGQQTGGSEILTKQGVGIPTLTDKETKVYQYMRDKYEELFKGLNTARTQSGIAPFPKVENYFTFFRNMAGEINDGVPFGELNFNKLNRPVFRFEKNRIIDNYGPLELDAIGGFLRYNRAAQKHIYLTPVVSKLRQLLDGKFTDGFSLRESNPYVYNELNGWVNRVAGMPSDAFRVPHGVERVMRQLNRNLMFGVLSYNPRTAAIQPSSILNTLTEIGPKYTMLGVKDFLQNSQKIMNESWGLFGREFDASVAEASNTIGGRVASLQHNVGEFGLKPLKILDMMTAQVTWAGAKRRGLSIGLNNHDAIAYAEDVVARTQAVATASEIAPIQSTAVGRLGTAFQTFVINNWGFLTRDVAGIGNPAITNKEAMKKVLTYIVGAQAFNLVYENGLHMRSPFPSPVRTFAESMTNDDDLTKAAWSSSKELFDQIPLIGGAFRYGSSPLGAGVQAINDLARFGRYDMTFGKGIETIGKVTGIPGTVAVKKAIKLANEEQ